METKSMTSASSEVWSDAWPSSSKPTMKSRAHAILLAIIESGDFNESKIEYRALSEED